jgi:hypothetical protein
MNQGHFHQPGDRRIGRALAQLRKGGQFHDLRPSLQRHFRNSELTKGRCWFSPEVETEFLSLPLRLLRFLLFSEQEATEQTEKSGN